MSDITVQKYQYYFAESTRLQSLVNEQAAYIEELEEALLQLTEARETEADFKKRIEQGEATDKSGETTGAEKRAWHALDKWAQRQAGIGKKDKKGK